MKKMVFVICCVAVLSFVVGGCKTKSQYEEERKNKTCEEVIRLLPEHFPYKKGDVVLLKPDRIPAVIVGITPYSSRGLYEVKYNSEGRDFTVKKFLEIKELDYRVRYPIVQEYRKTHILDQDEPTVFLHYAEIIVSWNEIYCKTTD